MSALKVSPVAQRKRIHLQCRDTRDVGSIPDPGGGNDNPFQYSCLENSVDRLWGHKEWDTNEHTCFASLSYIYGCCPFNESTQLLVLTSCPVKWPSCWRTSGLPDSPNAEPGARMTHTHSTQRGTLSHQAWVRGRSCSIPFSFLPAEAAEVTKAGVPATQFRGLENTTLISPPSCSVVSPLPWPSDDTFFWVLFYQAIWNWWSSNSFILNK